MATHVRLAMAVGIAALLCGFASVAVEAAAACDSGCPAVLSVLPSLVALQDSPAQVTITGTNLGAAVAVYIEPDNVIVPSTVLGATQVVVMIPASTPDGAYWFVVQTADWASREDPPVVVRVLHTQALATPDPSTSSDPLVAAPSASPSPTPTPTAAPVATIAPVVTPPPPRGDGRLVGLAGVIGVGVAAGSVIVLALFSKARRAAGVRWRRVRARFRKASTQAPDPDFVTERLGRLG